MSRAQPPGRGDIVRLNFDPQLGHEQAGFRPALVLSHTLYNAHSSMIVVCPITNNTVPWPFKVTLPEGSPVKGVVLVDQLRAIDWRARQVRFAGTCPIEVMEEIDAKMDVLFRGESRPAAS